MEDKKEYILKTLREHLGGLTITQIAKLTKLNYMTASKYLAILEAVGKVECRKIGMAKLFGVKK